MVDARCSALYFALARLSEVGESGNDASYSLSAKLFAGFPVRRLVSAEGVSEQEATSRLLYETEDMKNLYWQIFVRMDANDPVIVSDIPFCLDRGELYADGSL